MIRLFRYSEVTIMHMTSVHEQCRRKEKRKIPVTFPVNSSNWLLKTYMCTKFYSKLGVSVPINERSHFAQ